MIPLPFPVEVSEVGKGEQVLSHFCPQSHSFLSSDSASESGL